MFQYMATKKSKKSTKKPLNKEKVNVKIPNTSHYRQKPPTYYKIKPVTPARKQKTQLKSSTQTTLEPDVSTSTTPYPPTEPDLLSTPSTIRATTSVMHDFTEEKQLYSSENLLLKLLLLFSICFVLMCCLTLCIRGTNRLFEWIRSKWRKRFHKKLSSDENRFDYKEGVVDTLGTSSKSNHSYGSLSEGSNQRISSLSSLSTSVKKRNSEVVHEQTRNDYAERQQHTKDHQAPEDQEPSSDWEYKQKFREQEEKFQEALAKQRLNFEKDKMRRRKEREEIERESAEQLRQFQIESQQRIAAFLECVKLSARFEEKEQEWADLLNEYRKPIIKIINSYNSLQDEIRIYHTHKSDSDRDYLQNEGRLFASTVFSAQTITANNLETLRNLSENYSDRIFLKMIMKPICEQGCQMNIIGSKLVELLKLPEKYELAVQLTGAVSQLNPHSIPTTSWLTKKSPFAKREDYCSIETVPHPNWFQYFK